jgi:hypothetical protein
MNDCRSLTSGWRTFFSASAGKNSQRSPKTNSEKRSDGVGIKIKMGYTHPDIEAANRRARARRKQRLVQDILNRIQPSAKPTKAEDHDGLSLTLGVDVEERIDFG